MTKDELAQQVAKKSDITADEAGKIIDAFTWQIKEQLSRGEKVTISGFGSFILSKRGPQTFVNPKTGQKMDLPERNLPHFKAGSDFKKSLREK